MLIRLPFVLVWNLLRNILRFPFVLLQWFVGLWGSSEPQYIRYQLLHGLVRWRQSSWIDWWRDEPTDMTLDEWKTTLETIAKRKDFAGIVLDIDQLDASLTTIDDLRTFFDAFRKDGKRIVLVYKNHFGMGGLILSASADVTLVQPSASVAIITPAMEGLYLSGLLEKFGVEMVMERVGAHKNAPERMTRPFPSPTGRADMEEMLELLLKQLLPTIAEARGIEPMTLIARLEGGILSPEEALEAGLIDGIRYANRLEAYLRDPAPQPFEYPELPVSPHMPADASEGIGPQEAQTDTQLPTTAEKDQPEQAEGAEANAAQTDAQGAEGAEGAEATAKESEGTASVEAAKEAVEMEAPKKPEALAKPKEGDDVKEDEDDDDDELIVDADEADLEGLVWWRWTPLRRKPKIGVIPIQGTIVDEPSSSPMADEEAVRDPIVEAIYEAMDDRRIKGVIAYINSRGGSGTASEAIWYALRKLNEKKPVVAYLDDYAASGGYYIACGAQSMIANPWCITGSIGVFGGKPVVEDLLKRLQLGVMRVGDTTGSRLMSIYSRPTERERERFREQMQVFYERFVLRVADNRKRSYAEIEPLAQGRVYIAQDALDCGLIDGLGGLQVAVDKVRELADLPELPLQWLEASSKKSLKNIVRSQLMSLRAPTRIASPMTPQLHLPSQQLGPSSLLAGDLSASLANAVLPQLGLHAMLAESQAILSMLARGQVITWYEGQLKI